MTITVDNNNIYFPIIGINQGIDDLRKDERYSKVKNLIGEAACKFLEGAYNINEKHDKCLNLLKTSSKHRNTDKISKTKKAVSAKYHNLGGPQIRQDIYGNLNIPGCIYSAGNIHMSNCVISTPKGVTLIESLDTI